MATSIAAILTTDIAAQVRGRAFPDSEIPSYLKKGSGWVPANMALDPFGRIITPNPYGAIGDIRIIPDKATLAEITHERSGQDVTVLLGDLVNPDGSEWESCPRTFLRNAIRDFESETGLRIISSFEHEFMLKDEDKVSGRKPFSLESLLTYEPLGSQILGALEKAGLEPEMWLPEFGDRQWEVTLAPTDALRAADRAILLKEIVRHVVREHGEEATFSPIVEENGGGNGVHIHLSLTDHNGVPVTMDETREGKLSDVAGSFAAGILKYAEQYQALTASSVISYERLAPGRWSVGGLYLGENNREALLRICPLFNTPGADHASQYNLEYRAADATANPWLALAILIRAGLEGIRQGLASPKVVAGEPSELDANVLEEATYGEMPATLTAAIDALRGSDEVSSWLPELLLKTFYVVKDAEIELVDSFSDLERYDRYAESY